MADFIDKDLSGSRFERVNLSGAEFRSFYMVGTRFRGGDMKGVVIRGVDLVDVDMYGEIGRLIVNGVDVGPLVNGELDRRYPERAKMRPTVPDGYREAWAVIEGLWPTTIDRARRLPPELLHERVDGEWSFIETLRHLVFATDAWVRRAILGDPAPYDDLDLPATDMGYVEGVPNDPDARPGLDEVLALRADRMGTVREVIASLTDEQLAGTTEPVDAPGYPAPDAYPVTRCLRAILNEEWLHRQYAERDLAVLESRLAAGD
jgi:uncharacterized protein YjbI with pentapeptide repeats